MTTAIIGTGQLGSVIARALAAGGESLRLASADEESARALAAAVGPPAVVALDNGDALRGADVAVLALRFSVLKSVIDELGELLDDEVVIVPSNPVSLDARGNVVRILETGESSGEVLAGWLPKRAHLAMTFGTMASSLFESSSRRRPEPAVLFYVTSDDVASAQAERLIRVAGFEPARVGGVEQSTRLEVGGDLHDRVATVDEAKSLIDATVRSQ